MIDRALLLFVTILTTAFAALASLAHAEPPATVPTRVIRELHGQYTIETRPTSDGLHAGITADINDIVIPHVPLVQRLADGQFQSPVVFEPRLMDDGETFFTEVAGDLILQSSGWTMLPTFQFLNARQQARSEPRSKGQLQVLRDFYRMEIGDFATLRRIRAERNRFTTRTATPICIDTSNLPGGHELIGPARRVETTLNVILPPTTPAITIDLEANPSMAPQLAMNAPDEPLTPTFTWSPGVQGGFYYITIYSNASTTDDQIVHQSDPLFDATYTLATPLAPNTQYWWTVTAMNRNGAVATSSVRTFTTTGSACDSLDFNQDGVQPDTQDYIDFLSVFGGGPCGTDPNCSSDLDFNNDGVSPDSQDITDFLFVLGGGSC